MSTRHEVVLLVFTIRDGRLALGLIQRTGETFAGWWALPAGYLGPAETLREAAYRELLAEGVSPGQGLPLYLEQLGTYDDPHRDPRGRTLATAFIGLIPPDRLPLVAGSEPWQLRWFAVDDLPEPPPGAGRGGRRLAFDHDLILADGLARLRSKTEYTLFAFQMVPETFTLPQLAEVYGAIWGEPDILTPEKYGNFVRRMRLLNRRAAETWGTPVYEPTGQSVRSGGRGRAAALYRKTDALHAGLVVQRVGRAPLRP